MMVARVLAIAGTAVRGAIRSRVAVSLALLLAILLAGLLTGVHGDGSVAGRYRLLLTYGLGLAAGLVGAMALWLGAVALSTEFANRRLQLLVIKPIRYVDLWLGQWLAIGLLAGVLLTGVGVTLWVAVRLAAARATPGSAEAAALRQEIVTAWRITPLTIPGLDDMVEAELATLIATESAASPSPDIQHHIDRVLRMRHAVLTPGQPLTWRFRLPDAKASPHAANGMLEYSLFSKWRDVPMQPGRWTFYDEQGLELGRVTCLNRLAGRNRIEVPAACLPPGQVVDAAFTFLPGWDEPMQGAVLFDPDQPVSLLTVGGSLGLNMLRGLFLTWCGCMVLAALGLTCGVMFSPPVACFAAGAVALLYLAAAALPTDGADGGHHHHQDEAPPGVVAEALTHLSDRALGAFRRAAAPILTLRQRGRVAAGIRIGWHEPLTALLLLGGYGGFCALVGGLIFARREPARGA